MSVRASKEVDALICSSVAVGRFSTRCTGTSGRSSSRLLVLARGSSDIGRISSDQPLNLVGLERGKGPNWCRIVFLCVELGLVKESLLTWT